jgi:type I restriction enzyme S subunit
MELILKHVEPNDFVVSMRSFQGGIEWWGERGCISSAYVMLIPSCKVDPVFSCYLFKSSRYDGQAMRFDNFTQLDLPVVPEGEQARIAHFLDEQTEKIDALVEEQRRRYFALMGRLAGESYFCRTTTNPVSSITLNPSS